MCEKSLVLLLNFIFFYIFVWGREYIVENIYSKFTTHFVLVAFFTKIVRIYHFVGATEKEAFVYYPWYCCRQCENAFFFIHCFLFLKWSLWDKRTEKKPDIYILGGMIWYKPFIESCGVVIVNKATKMKD